MKKDNNIFLIFQEAAVAIFLSIVTFILMMKSPLNPWGNDMSATDSSVFRYIAFVMLKGGMPYKDAFDHKGPLLYLIDYAGLLLSENNGIWIIECIFMFIFVLVAYKTARLASGRIISCFIVVTATTPLSYYFESGNLTEEYAMPFIAIALFLFIDYFLNHEINKKRLILCGISFGAVIMLRANMISVWIVFCLAVVFLNIKEQKKIPFDFLSWFLVGTAIVIVPIFIWLIHGKAFSYFINDYLLFNMKYSSFDARANLFSRCGAILHFLNCDILLISIIALFYLIKRKSCIFFHFVYMISILLTLLMMSLSGMTYPHYGMVLVPLFVYPLSKLCYLIGQEEHSDSIIAIFAMIVLLIVFPVWTGKLESIADLLHKSKETIVSEGNKVLFEVIEANTDEDEKIMVIGNMNFYYIKSHRLAASRYSYQYPIAEIDEKIQTEFTQDLITNMPKIIIVQDYESSSSIKLFVTKDSYELLYVANDTTGIYRIKERY